MKTVLCGNSVDAVGRVEVLDRDELEAGGTALARCDAGPSQEKLPSLVSLLAVFSREPSASRKLTRYQVSPNLALMVSLFPTQLRYHRQMVAE